MSPDFSLIFGGNLSRRPDYFRRNEEAGGNQAGKLIFDRLEVSKPVSHFLLEAYIIFFLFHREYVFPSFLVKTALVLNTLYIIGISHFYGGTRDVERELCNGETVLEEMRCHADLPDLAR